MLQYITTRPTPVFYSYYTTISTSHPIMYIHPTTISDPRFLCRGLGIVVLG